MRFSENGPEIPDHLLWERDAGNVVFMCGAGVSAQNAKLPDFRGLASKVMKYLGVTKNSRAHKLLNIYNHQEGQTVSIDKIFGILEREYYPIDISKALAAALSYSKEFNLECHEIIRDLATAPSKEVRLVTTNFDNLFSKVTQCPEWIGPELPDMKNPVNFSGLVYLHGNSDQLSIQKNASVVLSSTSFGKAYLLDGWATTFLKSILENYTVIFIGYSADDPPVEYLLEALADFDSSKQTTYAFQLGSQKDANEKWKPRGVEPICFDDYNNLWDTLGLWRRRALNFSGWADEILKMAQAMPEELKEWQRCQVTHLAMHPMGARSISNSMHLIPPEWLCMLDSEYSNSPSYQVCNAFGSSDYDEFEISKETFFDKKSSFSINRNYHIPKRLKYLSDWISRISDNPKTLKWVISKGGLHYDLQRCILSNFTNSKDDSKFNLEKSWEELFESWKRRGNENPIDVCEVQDIVKESKWTLDRIIKYQKVLEPWLDVIESKDLGEETRSQSSKYSESMITFNVHYPNVHLEYSHANGFEREMLLANRQNLNTALFLENRAKHGKYQYSPNLDIDLKYKHNMADGIHSLLKRYCESLIDFSKFDSEAAFKELKTWEAQDYRIYDHILIIILKNNVFFSGDKSEYMISQISDNAFWDSTYRKRLLCALKNRLNTLDSEQAKKIETRILKGPSYDYTTPEDKAHKSLCMLQFLQDNNCNFQLNFSEKIDELKRACSSWNCQDVENFVNPVSSSTVAGDKDDWNFLKLLSPDKVLDEASRYANCNSIILQDSSNFKSYCKNNLHQIFSALRSKAKSGDYPLWAWSTWFNLDWSEECYRKYISRTTVMIIKASNDNDDVYNVLFLVYNWFHRISDQYYSGHFGLRDCLFWKLHDTLKSKKRARITRDSFSCNQDVDWFTYANSSPVGELVDALANFCEYRKLKDNCAISAAWLDKASHLISLEGDNGRFALVKFVYHMNDLNRTASRWVHNSIILASRSKDPDTRRAFWHGVGNYITDIDNYDLFLSFKKPMIREVSADEYMNDDVSMALSKLIFLGWTTVHNGEKLILDCEYRKLLKEGSEKLRIDALEKVFDLKYNYGFNRGLNIHQDVERFLLNVWPLDRFVVSTKTNMKLLQVLFNYSSLFPRFMDILIPRFQDVGLDNGICDEKCIIGPNIGIISRRYPDALLDVLKSLAPNNLSVFGASLGKALKVIEISHPKMKTDGRLMYLQSFV